jgi:Fis family transcriptional regulator, factor for inversion stimulation protein
MNCTATEEEESAEDLIVERPESCEPLRECVRTAVQTYFADLNGHSAGDLYRMVICEVEQPLLEIVMRYARGNQTRAADILGLNRSTLRKKLRQYGLD